MNVLMAKDIINVPLLIKGCRTGNRSSQLRLYEHFYGYGMGVCLRYCKNREEARYIMKRKQKRQGMQKMSPSQLYKH